MQNIKILMAKYNKISKSKALEKFANTEIVTSLIFITFLISFLSLSRIVNVGWCF